MVKCWMLQVVVRMTELTYYSGQATGELIKNLDLILFLLQIDEGEIVPGVGDLTILTGLGAR